MHNLQKRVVCLVETGWEGIRGLTLDLVKEGIASSCIIKGKLDNEVLEMITKYNQISLKSIRRSLFKVYIFMMFLKNFLLRNTICIVMDSKKNYHWVNKINKALRVKTILLVQDNLDYSLFNEGRPIEYEDCFNL
jgi:hypothetical protein